MESKQNILKAIQRDSAFSLKNWPVECGVLLPQIQGKVGLKTTSLEDSKGGHRTLSEH